MYAVIRSYTGASALMAEMERRSGEVEEAMEPVAGFRSYYAVRAGDGLTAITICKDRAGAEESTRVAADWVKNNVPSAKMSAPHITEGEVFLHFGE